MVAILVYDVYVVTQVNWGSRDEISRLNKVLKEVTLHKVVIELIGVVGDPATDLVLVIENSTTWVLVGARLIHYSHFIHCRTGAFFQEKSCGIEI